MSEPMPRVSVVLPTLNAANHIQQALDSLFGQTFDDFEIVVVDDGSTDDTMSIIESYKDERIRVVQRKEPDNLAGALNRGINIANGEYIARQDADDISAPDRLARQVAFLNTHPEVALVGTGTRIISESGQYQGYRHVLERPTIEDFLESNQIAHGSVMYRKDEVLDATGGYDTLFSTSEDYDLWIRLARHYPVRNIDAPLYTLRLREESVFADDLLPAKLFGWYACHRVRENEGVDINEDIRKEGPDAIYRSLTRTERSDIHAEIAKEFLRYGRQRAAFKEAIQALNCSPQAVEAVGLAGLSLAPERVREAVISVVRSRLNKQIIDRNASPVDRNKLTETFFS